MRLEVFRRLTQHRNTWYLLTAALVVCSIFVWTSDLTSDPPTYFGGSGQSLATDPSQYVFHARNKVLFDDWDPFNYGRWTVFRHSLTSLTAWFWFSVTNVSQEQSAVVGIILCLASLVVLLFGVGRYHRGWVTCAVAFCFVTNVTLLTFGRLPFLENGLIFIASLIFLVYTSWGNRMSGVVVAGALVAPAMLMGKMFGLLLLPSLAGAILLMERERRWKMLAASVAAFVGSALALFLILYYNSASQVFQYIGEQGLGLYGLPAGVTSPWLAVEKFISYGFQNRLWFNSPDLLLFAILGTGITTLLLQSRRSGIRISRVTALSLSWSVCGLLAFGQFSYSPMRYVIFCIPPIIIMFFSSFETYIASRDKVAIGKRGLWQLILPIVLLWISLYQITANLFYQFETTSPIRWLIWSGLGISALVVLLTQRLIGERTLKVSCRVLTIILVGAICSSAITNFYKVREVHFSDRNYSMATASKELPMILSEGAVISGPYGPALTLDSKIKSFIHMFGVARPDPTLFERHPITHLALDLSNWQKAVEAYPQLGTVPPITSYRIRDIEVRLFNISKVFNNTRAVSYRESLYEVAYALYFEGNFDSSLVVAERFVQLHPGSVSGGLLLGDVLFSLNQYDSLVAHIKRLTDRFPDDFNVHFRCGRHLQMVSGVWEDSHLLTLARKHYQRAIDIDPYRQQEIQRTHDDLQKGQEKP